MELQPKAVTAAMIGLRSRLDSFKLQRFVNEYPEEALAAILPGVALQQLWGLVGVAETALGAWRPWSWSPPFWAWRPWCWRP